MKKGSKSLFSCVCLLTFCFLFGACENRTKAESQEPNKQQGSRSSADKSCAAMTAEISTIAERKLRQRPIDISAPEEGILRGCVWSEDGGGFNTYQITKEPASRYKEHHEDEFRKAFPDRFKALEGFGDKGFVSPTISEGWAACVLKSSGCFCVEITGKGTTGEQATKLLQLALDRF